MFYCHPQTHSHLFVIPDYIVFAALHNLHVDALRKLLRARFAALAESLHLLDVLVHLRIGSSASWKP